MRQLALLSAVVIIAIASGCGGNTGGDPAVGKKRHQEADTGFTGTRTMVRNNVKMKEITYKNGIREGMTRTYTKGGLLEQEIPYSGDKRNGDARWYYPEGQVFRLTPFVNDTIHGDQIQYYKNGNVRARITFIENNRKPGIEEYTMNGEKITNYPEITYRVVDDYAERGLYKIFVEMDDLSENVKYYRGDYVNGLVVMDSLKPTLQTATTGYLDLRKSEKPGADSAVVIASYLTPSGNRLYYRIAIPLPYKDLN